MRRDLSSQSLETERLGERRRHLEEALERANGQISNFEHWSEGVHDELRQVASELREDQVASDMERQQLQARAAELERQCYPPTFQSPARAAAWSVAVNSSSTVPWCRKAPS